MLPEHKALYAPNDQTSTTTTPTSNNNNNNTILPTATPIPTTHTTTTTTSSNLSSVPKEINSSKSRDAPAPPVNTANLLHPGQQLTVCNSCRQLLRSPHGSEIIRCPKCHTVNIIVKNKMVLVDANTSIPPVAPNANARSNSPQTTKLPSPPVGPTIPAHNVYVGTTTTTSFTPAGPSFPPSKAHAQPPLQLRAPATPPMQNTKTNKKHKDSGFIPLGPGSTILHPQNAPSNLGITRLSAPPTPTPPPSLIGITSPSPQLQPSSVSMFPTSYHSSPTSTNNNSTSSPTSSAHPPKSTSNGVSTAGTRPFVPPASNQTFTPMLFSPPPNPQPNSSFITLSASNSTSRSSPPVPSQSAPPHTFSNSTPAISTPPQQPLVSQPPQSSDSTSLTSSQGTRSIVDTSPPQPAAVSPQESRSSVQENVGSGNGEDQILNTGEGSTSTPVQEPENFESSRKKPKLTSSESKIMEGVQSHPLVISKSDGNQTTGEDTTKPVDQTFEGLPDLFEEGKGFIL